MVKPTEEKARSWRPGWKTWVAATVWLGALCAGVVWLSRYSNTPGEGAAYKTKWPSESAIPRTGKPTLVVFAHPECPCSTASVGELERLIPRLKDKVDVHVVFVRPSGRTPASVQGSLWEKAKAVPGVNLVLDPEYRETDLFGAKTSGQTLFYDGDGTLVFSGGITPSRGHMGDSVGRDFILEWLGGYRPHEPFVAKVFGCALREMNSFPNAEAKAVQ